MSVPADAKLKEIYPVSLNFITVSMGESGAFSLSGAIGTIFAGFLISKIGATYTLASSSVIIFFVFMFYLRIKEKRAE